MIFILHITCESCLFVLKVRNRRDKGILFKWEVSHIWVNMVDMKSL